MPHKPFPALAQEEPRTSPTFCFPALVPDQGAINDLRDWRLAGVVPRSKDWHR